MTKTKINMTVNDTRQQDKIELQTLNQICLKENNRLRYLHNSPKLRLSNRLMKSAQLHSEHLHELRQLQQLTDLECGQNMALIIGEKNYKIAGLNAVRAWYKQSENYDYNEHNQEFKVHRKFYRIHLGKLPFSPSPLSPPLKIQFLPFTPHVILDDFRRIY
ncbi:Golgi-associated plant pathogenesis-related protein isoform 2 [Schistosoma japonicum]|uniref:Golgi-associated plant pathogenesis-related protein isoform 2 n=1 Tax=Schistosoma japonicum TaxID=6182 RepID=A0A4Z2DFD3_SCHJA|nr:Golgi-associated plant pathogenesis-related protein isoform 2 [Schistosoma japonicum]